MHNDALVCINSAASSFTCNMQPDMSDLHAEYVHAEDGHAEDGQAQIYTGANGGALLACASILLTAPNSKDCHTRLTFLKLVALHRNLKYDRLVPLMHCDIVAWTYLRPHPQEIHIWSHA